MTEVLEYVPSSFTPEFSLGGKLFRAPLSKDLSKSRQVQQTFYNDAVYSSLSRKTPGVHNMTEQKTRRSSRYSAALIGTSSDFKRSPFMLSLIHI